MASFFLNCKCTALWRSVPASLITSNPESNSVYLCFPDPVRQSACSGARRGGRGRWPVPSQVGDTLFFVVFFAPSKKSILNSYLCFMCVTMCAIIRVMCAHIFFGFFLFLESAQH